LELQSVSRSSAERAVAAVAQLAQELPDYEVLVSIGGGHFERDLQRLAREYELEIVRIEPLSPRLALIARLIPSHGALLFVPRAARLLDLFLRTAPYALWGVFLVPTRLDPGLRRLLQNVGLRHDLHEHLWSRSDVAGYTFDLDNDLGTIQVGRDVPDILRGLPPLGKAEVVA